MVTEDRRVYESWEQRDLNARIAAAHPRDHLRSADRLEARQTISEAAPFLSRDPFCAAAGPLNAG
jgi:hypothetical protein